MNQMEKNEDNNKNNNNNSSNSLGFGRWPQTKMSYIFLAAPFCST